jgi:hypothetical protein
MVQTNESPRKQEGHQEKVEMLWEIEEQRQGRDNDLKN